MIEPLPPLSEIEALITPPQQASGRGLVRAVIVLSQALRARGVGVGLASVLDALKAAELVGPASPQDLRQALAAALTATPAEREVFDDLFDRFFFGLGREEAGRGEEERAKEGFTPYSPVEVLAARDLRRLVGQEAERATALLDERLAALLARPSRRLRPGPKGRRLDFRRTWRRSLSGGGEIIDLAWARRRERRRRLILLLDVSGSMDPHACFLIAFARAWLAALPGRVEVMAFSTRLKRLTPLLAGRPLQKALEVISRFMPEWSGGTRIGACLAELLAGPDRGLVSSSSVAAILSDGWDQGDIPLLERQMARLSGRARRVVWLNPLAGSPGYEPLCSGMQARL
ncbi:MAG: VWA domain-containing protein, partial [Deltaproteobacteria bacterium]|nr:VWA domain-containing protein [Deltaproteobacteria bacterium]